MQMECYDGPFNGRLIEADESLSEVVIDEAVAWAGFGSLTAQYRVSRPANEKPRLVHIRGTDDAF